MDETYVPGLNREKSRKNISNSPFPGNDFPEVNERRYAGDNDKEEIPVVGFLYSLSRGGEPEWWPLHIGQNKIGKDADMDICLAEASITGHHANINIKRMRRSGNALAASIVDVGSKNGIILNDEEIDYEPHTIKNEDIVTFGLSYKCVIILVDPTKYGLTVSEEFVAAGPATKRKAEQFVPVNEPKDENPGIPERDPFEGLDRNATVNISGTGIDLSGGSTKIL